MRSPRKIQHLHGPSLLAEVDDEAAPNSPTTGAVGELLESLTTVRLTQCIGDAEALARLGGDEFAIILEQRNGKAEARG